MPLRVAFRLDANPQLGIGHLMRCLTLANALAGEGGRCRFLLPPTPLTSLIIQAGHAVEVLPEAQMTETEDAAACLSLLQQAQDWMVVDHYRLAADWERSMRAKAARILAIDDLADRVHDADLLLDQNELPGKETRYEGLLPTACQLLLGARYALLRPEFSATPPRLRGQSVRRILVNFGGSDPGNVTSLALDALELAGWGDKPVDIVIGALHGEADALAARCASHAVWTLHRQTNNMAELMDAADLALAASGSSLWERCARGLPAVLLTLAANQAPLAAAAAHFGAALWPGSASDLNASQLADIIRAVEHCSTLLAAMSRNASGLCDGHGVTRVVSAMLATKMASQMSGDAAHNAGLSITVVCSDNNHPIYTHLQKWAVDNSAKHRVHLMQDVTLAPGGDILFLISCSQVVKQAVRSRYARSLVVHASDLPKGRGWSPHIWQIANGKEQFTVTLLAAEDAVDSGDIHHQITLHFDGTELFDEINERLFKAEISLMDWALSHFESMPATKQIGESTYFRKRTPADSRIDIQKSILEQFNTLRVADPVRYPAYFELRGFKYSILIRKSERIIYDN